MYYFLRISVSVLFLFSCLSACGGNQASSVNSVNVTMMQVSTQAKNTENLNKLVMKSQMLRTADPNVDYVIGSEDLLEIDVLQAEELKKEVRVNYRGFIGLPVIGLVRAKGLTLVQLEKELTVKYEKYLNNPHVSVHIKEYKSQKIAVTGAVAKPQVYSIVGQKYLIDMLFMAEGLKDAGKNCFIFRPGSKDGAATTGDVNTAGTETIIIDLYELLDKGDRKLNIPVFSGDIIHVPSGGVIYVDGAVKKRGMFKLSGKTTLLQAIAMAEGMVYTSDASDIKILRDTGTGERKIITADYDKAQNDTSGDLLIQDNDIIIVGTSAVKSALNTFFNMVRGAISIGSSGSSVSLAPPVLIGQ